MTSCILHDISHIDLFPECNPGPFYSDKYMGAIDSVSEELTADPLIYPSTISSNMKPSVFRDIGPKRLVRLNMSMRQRLVE